MLKFSPATFTEGFVRYDVRLLTTVSAAEQAQQIFDAWIKENGKVVFGKIEVLKSPEGDSFSFFNFCDKNFTTHKALLINIEPIEKCTHPKEKVTGTGIMNVYPQTKKLLPQFECDCGAKVRPKEFEAIE